jgi:acyl-coenzyme A thioesterase PaaI-like protein
VALVHHELCFGCGRVNLFGLLLELEPAGPGGVAGRGFLKQDHQGPDRGQAHEGIVATALLDAMALACGPGARVTAFEISYSEPAPVGAFLDIEARVERRDGPSADASATARADQRMVAQARGRYRL